MRRGLRLLIAAALSASLLLGATSCTRAASSPYRLSPPAQGVYVGVFSPPAPWTISRLDSYNALVGKRAAFDLWYQAWSQKGMNKFDGAACVAVLERGAVPVITWEPWDTYGNSHDRPDQPAYRLANIVNGTYDAYIRSWARGVREVRGPVMIRLMHEMNGNWYPWAGTVNGNTPAEYVAAWRHVHDIFKQEGAENVSWIWSINRESVPNTDRNSFSAYYPGDDYVDWTAMSGFNWGTARKGTVWHSFDFTYAHALSYLETLDKPIFIAEIGCVENGGDKAAWLTDAFAKIRKEHPKVKALAYYEAVERSAADRQDWRVESSPASLAAFKAALADPYYLGGPTSTLTSWTSTLKQRDWNDLRGIARVY
jgi:hypothetical protein